MQEYLNANQAHWNELTPFHVKSKFYDVGGFKNGKTSLTPIELGELGDVSNKSLLHLECHFGLDTMSWARQGARVTGVDFSEQAIEAARSLSRELGIDARFILSNFYDLPDNLEDTFDIVFTSYGVINWLPDLPKWAQVINHFLKSGGTFYIAEFHPFAGIFNEEDDSNLTVHYPYFHLEEPLIFYSDGSGSYADSEATITTPSYEWQHSMADIINALISVGLRIEFLHEFPYSVYKEFPFMERSADGFWRLNRDEDKVPLLFSIKAVKPDA